jgi:hypothetical protein
MNKSLDYIIANCKEKAGQGLIAGGLAGIIFLNSLGLMGCQGLTGGSTTGNAQNVKTEKEVYATKQSLTIGDYEIISLSQADGEAQLREFSLNDFETAWFYKDGKWIFNSKGKEGAGEVPIDISKVPEYFKDGSFYHTHNIHKALINPLIEWYQENPSERKAIAKSNLIESIAKPIPPTFPQDYAIISNGYAGGVVDPTGVWKYSRKPNGIDDIALRSQYLGLQGKEDAKGYAAAVNRSGGDLSYTSFSDRKLIEDYAERLLEKSK